MKEIEIYAVQNSVTYNFMIDENTPLGLLAEEVVSVISQKEQTDIDGNLGDAVFYDMVKKTVLDMTKTPSELDIKSGDKLYLV